MYYDDNFTHTLCVGLVSDPPQRLHTQQTHPHNEVGNLGHRVVTVGQTVYLSCPVYRHKHHKYHHHHHNHHKHHQQEDNHNVHHHQTENNSGGHSDDFTGAGSGVDIDSRPRDLFVDWTKDRASVAEVNSRMQITAGGKLRIENVQLYDAGVYICKTYDKLGAMIEIESNLIVLGE